jgi:acetyl esterase
LGDRDTHDALCRRLANRASSIVVSVEYRRAPENKFPTPLEDCFAASCFVAENAHLWQGDAGRLAVAGDSAGGNLAAAVAIMARDRGGPAIQFQLLLYPVLQKDFETRSYRAYAEGYGLTRGAMEWFWRQYLRDDNDAQNPYAAPLRTEDPSRLPPTHVVTAEYDVLRDVGHAIAGRLREAGVPTTDEQYQGMIHGFTHFSGVFDIGQQSLDDAAAVLRAALHA